MEFLTIALSADASGRETLFRSASTAGKSDDSELRLALLRSVPGHSGYDPVAARSQLNSLASRAGVTPEIAAVARLRLAQGDQEAAQAAEIAQLKQRLARVVEIEKRQGSLKENGK